jgi:hypothetical protein
VIACFVVDAIELFIFAGRCICAYAALQVLMFGWNRFMNWCSTGRSANEGAAP